MDFPQLAICDDGHGEVWLRQRFHPYGLRCPQCDASVKQARVFGRTCLVFPGDPEHIHWSFSDPTEVQGDTERLRSFEQTAQQLQLRIQHLLILIARGQTKP